MTTSALDDSFLADVAQSAYGWPESLRFTYDKTRELLANGTAGDLVECGVGNGVHPAMFARACQDAGVRRNIRLFDSFAGVPHGNEHDATWNEHYGDGSGRLEPTGVAVASLASVQANLERWGCDGAMFSFFVGWFEETLPEIAPKWRARYEKGEAEGIALLRLDGDLYESTKVCLEHLWPLMVPRAILVVDDLNLEGCRQAVSDYFGFMPAFQEITASGDGWMVKA